MRNTTLFRKPADQEDGRIMSQNNHHLEVWMPGYFTDGSKGEEVKLKKRPLILQISPGIASLG